VKAACFTVAAIDYFPQQDSYFAGGNALNQSIRLSTQGVNCSFIGAIGDDVHGDKIYSLLSRNKIDLHLLETLEGGTASNRIINDNSGERFGESNAWDGGVFDVFRIKDKAWDYISKFDIWSTHSSCPNFKETIARKGTATLCVDYLHLPRFQTIFETIDNVDIAYVGGNIEMVESLFELSTKRDKLIVLTLGDRGSMAFYQGHKYLQPSLPSKVIDTTGCGDAFQSGFTCSFLEHRDVEKALLTGAEMGCLATKHYGGVEW